MAGSDKLVIVTDAMIAMLEDNAELHGIKKVWYGEESLIPEVPAISVTPDTKTRNMIETGRMTLNTFRIYVTIYHSKLDTPEVTRKECDVLAEDIEALIHEHPNMDGTVIHGYVTEVTPGFARRNRVIMRSTRMTWTGTSKTRLF